MKHFLEIIFFTGIGFISGYIYSCTENEYGFHWKSNDGKISIDINPEKENVIEEIEEAINEIRK